jgi:hypothetical protein
MIEYRYLQKGLTVVYEAVAESEMYQGPFSSSHEHAAGAHPYGVSTEMKNLIKKLVQQGSTAEEVEAKIEAFYSAKSKPLVFSKRQIRDAARLVGARRGSHVNGVTHGLMLDEVKKDLQIKFGI